MLQGETLTHRHICANLSAVEARWREIRKLAAILAPDVVGYSRLAGADEDRILARLRALRSDLIDPTIAVHNGRIVKRTGDGAIVEFRSVVDAVRAPRKYQRSPQGQPKAAPICGHRNSTTTAPNSWRPRTASLRGLRARCRFSLRISRRRTCNGRIPPATPTCRNSRCAALHQPRLAGCGPGACRSQRRGARGAQGVSRRASTPGRKRSRRSRRTSIPTIRVISPRASGFTRVYVRQHGAGGARLSLNFVVELRPRQGDWGSTSDGFHPRRPQPSFDHTSRLERPRDQRRPWARARQAGR